MPRTPPYRTSAGAPIIRPRALPRWTLVVLFIAAVIGGIFLIAGAMGGEVLLTLMQGAFVLPVLLPAVLLGSLLTAPLAKAQAFAGSPWPDAFRLVTGTALGLGALALGTLLLGSLGLVGYGIPLVLLLVVAGVGYLPARDFFTRFDYSPLKAPAGKADYLVLLAAIPLALMLVAATYPPGTLWLSEGRGYDVLEYHLQCPREYLANGSTAPLRHNVYSFLPANVEMLYLLEMCLVRIVESTQSYLFAIYPSQLLHSLLMLLTAGAVGLAPLPMARAARWLAVLAFIGTPWVLITGSLAYDEGGMLLFGALAMALALGKPSRAVEVAIGVLLGLAVGCKLTAGTMFAIPVAAMLGLQRRYRALPVVVLLAAVVYCPWALRAAGATRNPVFPMATNVFGTGHWSTAQAKRWDEGHRPAVQATMGGALAYRAVELPKQSVLDGQWSPGISAMVRFAYPQERGEGTGVPSHIGVLWIAAAMAGLLAIWRGPQAWLLLAVLAIQVACWMFLTHLQARFLLPALVPLAWLIGIGASVLPLPGAVIGSCVGLHAILTMFLLVPENGMFSLRSQRDLPPIGALPRYPELMLARPAESRIPENITTLLVGDAAALYYHGQVIAHTVFDADPLLEHLRRAGPEAARGYLAARGVNYLVINRGEMERLARTYGLEADVGPLHDEAARRTYLMKLFGELDKLTANYPVLARTPQMALYEVSPPLPPVEIQAETPAGDHAK